MIRADQDPSTVGTTDPDANGAGVAGYWTSGPICTIVGPDAMNHLQEEVARVIEGHGVTLDFAEKGQFAAIFGNTTGPYGNGADGDLVHPAGPALTLTSDRHYENLTLEAGAEVITNNCRLFVRGVLTMEEGSVIRNTGGDGGDYTGGANGGAAGLPGGLAGCLGGGGAGGQGGNNPGGIAQVIQDGISGKPDGFTPGNGWGYAGSGGDGGDGNPGINQPGGPGAIINAQSTVTNPTYLPAMISAALRTQQDFNMFSGGAGGGGGGAGDNAVNPNGFGGGAGAGGGVIVVAARTLVGPTAPDTAAFIEADGGDGGSDTTFGTANGGGGGGGGGGTVFLTTRVRLGDPGLLVLSASLGLGGGAVTAQAGDNGIVGDTFELFA